MTEPPIGWNQPPPPQPGYQPPPQPGYQPQQPGYQPAYQQDPAYQPPAQPGYPLADPAQGGFPPVSAQPGYPEQGGYPAQPGYPPAGGYPPPGSPPLSGMPGYPPPVPQRGVNMRILLIAAGAVLAVILVTVGALVIVPSLGGDSKTPAGAVAAYNHLMDLVKKRDYAGVYDMMDRPLRDAISKDDFVSLAKCVDMAKSAVKEDERATSATVNGDHATVTVTRSSTDEDDSDMDDDSVAMIYEGHHWHIESGADSADAGSLLMAKALCK